MAWNFPGAGGGGGGRTTSYVTAGSGAGDDYTTPLAAIDAMPLGGVIVVTSDVTEASDVALPVQNFRIIFERDFTWTFNNNVQLTKASYNLKNFEVWLNGANIAYANDTQGIPLNITGSGSVKFYGGGSVANTSTLGANTQLIGSAIEKYFFGHYVFTLPNANACGISTTTYGTYIESMEFIGGGSSCYHGLQVLGTVGSNYIGNLEFSGTWSTSNAQVPWRIDDTSTGKVEYIQFTSGSASDIEHRARCDNLSLNAVAKELTLYADTRIYSGSMGASNTFVFPSPLGGLVFKDVDGAGFEIEPHRISYKETATTGNVKTELFIDASALRLAVAIDQSYLCNLRLISQRDQQDYAVFQWLGAVIHNDNGTTTIGNGATATTPDTSLNTGSSLTLDIEADNTNDALAVFVTANAAENWSHKLTVDLVEITN